MQLAPPYFYKDAGSYIALRGSGELSKQPDEIQTDHLLEIDELKAKFPTHDFSKPDSVRAKAKPVLP